MKRFKIFLFLFQITVSVCYPQYYSGFTRITNGYTDGLPSFGTQPAQNWSFYTWEFLAFERIIGAYGKIYVMKIGQNGPLDTGINLTNNVFINGNPSIAYSSCVSFCNNYTIKRAMVVWQTNQNSYFDIYGSMYYDGQGWTVPFPVAVSQTYKLNPKVCCVDTNHFAVVYQAITGDVYFKRYLNGSWLADTNLTETEPMPCTNPYITTNGYASNSYSFIVTYQKYISPSQTQIIYIKRDYNSQWTLPDTVASLGVNVNSGFVSTIGGGHIFCIFETNRLGNWTIYSTDVSLTSNFKVQQIVINDPSARNVEYAASNIPYISDDNMIVDVGEAYVKKKNDSTRVMDRYQPLYYVGDSNAVSTLTVGRGVYMNQGVLKFWLVFNKDTLAGKSNLYAASQIMNLGAIKPVSGEIPNTFSLHQNYPNPFNASTKFKIQISKLAFAIVNVFDILGREVVTPVNEQLKPGTYEVEWDATNFPSGVYYYKLTAGDFSETKKMVLLK